MGGFSPKFRNSFFYTLWGFTLFFFLNHKFPKLGIVSTSKLQAFIYAYENTNRYFTLSCLHVNADGVRAYIVFWFIFGHLQGVQGPKGQKGEPYIVAPEIIRQYRVRLQLQQLFLPSFQTRDGE